MLVLGHSKRCLVIWTRASDHWLDDQRLFPPGIPLESWPCIDTMVHTDAEVAASCPSWLPEIVVFTSMTAVLAAAKCPVLAPALNHMQCAVTFGSKTASAIDQAGWPLHRFLHATSAAQLPSAIAQAGWAKRPVWVLGPDSPSFDVATALRQIGGTAQHVPVYQTKPQAPKITLKSLAENQGLKVLCFASPSAVQGFLSVEGLPPLKKTQHLIAVAIGTTTARMCRDHFAQVRVATSPVVESLARSAVLEWTTVNSALQKS